MNSLSDDLFLSISPQGNLVAICTPDGVIKFYETLTGSLKLEYSSSSHLKGVCSCLEWCKTTPVADLTTQTSAQKKIKTNSTTNSLNNRHHELNDANLISIGTSEGSILIYHVAKATLHTQLKEDSLSNKVNDLCWTANYSIYSCSNEGSIIEWSLTESKVKCKWKASKTAITSILVDSKLEYLLSSSKSIAIWDLKTKTKLKTLTGHSNDIFKMLNLNNRISIQNEAQTVNDYYITAALNDRVINTWMLLPSADLPQSSSASLLSFAVNDSPIYIDIINLDVKTHQNTVALLLVITSKGQLLVYLNELVSNQVSKSKKASSTSSSSSTKPLRQLSVETKEGVGLKISASFLTNAQNERIDAVEIDSSIKSSSGSSDFATEVFKHLTAQYCLYILYGSSVNPRIEKLQLSELSENKTLLVREDPGKISVSLQTQNTKIETPSVAKDLKVLVPSLVGPQMPTNSLNLNNSGNKRKSNETNQITLEERLDLMGINSETNGDVYLKSGNLPTTDNLMVLLVQGLQSNDAKSLNHVLQHKNDKVINKTVSLLPSQYVVLLINELNRRLQGHAQSGLGIIKWIKAVLMIHTSYLMSYPELLESLGKVYEMMNARTKLFPQLSKLQGKLQLAMSQISSQTEKLQTSSEKDTQELLYYQESTSEDEQIEDDLIPSHSEFDEYLFSDEEEDSTQEEGANTTNN